MQAHPPQLDVSGDLMYIRLNIDDCNIDQAFPILRSRPHAVEPSMQTNGNGLYVRITVSPSIPSMLATMALQRPATE